ncbi:hypothetical protein DSO57_1006816 [Entomophthora muscae]|uniref:Uncharacterized protein n=1 Tax=Entomophthora muscae TaxID=34485 RepID=A0ACC2TUQ0_9FUNG|nr:hypothetical protein DSO57_1006816 [Entomophthora muscae]
MVNGGIHDNWDLHLPAALFAYCLSKHPVTGNPPFAMLYGHEAITLLLLGALLLSSDKALDPDACCMSGLLGIASKNWPWVVNPKCNE